MFKMRGWLILANDHEPKSPIFSSKILSCLLSPSFEAEKSLGRITIRLKGEVDMKWWLFRVIGVERLLWWLRAGTKQMTFQWQSTSIGFRLFGSTMTIRFSRAIQSWQMWEEKTNDFSMAIQGKSNPHAAHFMARQGWDALKYIALQCTVCVMHKSTVHSNSFGSGSVLAMHWAL